MAISRSGKTAPVHRWRCFLTQQLSGPVTDTKLCVTFQFVTAEEGGAVDEEPTGGGPVIGEELVGEEEPPPQAVRISTSASVEILACIRCLLSPL
jgi:hypothetical protein